MEAIPFDQHTFQQWFDQHSPNTLQLPGKLLVQVVTSATALGPTWSGIDDEMLIMEEQLGQSEVKVFLRSIRPHFWALRIVADPPLVGNAYVELLAGGFLYREHFDSAGEAEFVGLSTAALSDVERDLFIALSNRKTV